MEPCECAMTVHRGGYSTLSEAYGAVVSWIIENGYEIAELGWRNMFLHRALKQRPVMLAELLHAHHGAVCQNIHRRRIFDLNYVTLLICHNITRPFKY